MGRSPTCPLHNQTVAAHAHQTGYTGTARPKLPLLGKHVPESIVAIQGRSNGVTEHLDGGFSGVVWGVFVFLPKLKIRTENFRLFAHGVRHAPLVLPDERELRSRLFV